MFTLNQLRKIMPDAGARADLYYQPLLAGMQSYQIANVNRMAAFLATIAHESGELRYSKEIWGPTSAQERYEGRADLGNNVVGDGKRFLGRGLIQITGRSNYAQISKAFNVDFISQPELLETPQFAAASACWWWATHGCNQAADIPDFIAVTKIVNGGLNGLADRQKFYSLALSVLSVPDFSNVQAGVNTHDGH
jgi:putative chitinase